jgi:hypothetical protein
VFEQALQPPMPARVALLRITPLYLNPPLQAFSEAVFL